MLELPWQMAEQGMNSLGKVGVLKLFDHVCTGEDSPDDSGGKYLFQGQKDYSLERPPAL